MKRDLPTSATPLLGATRGAITESTSLAAGILVAITEAHTLSDSERDRLVTAYGAIGEFLGAHSELGLHAIEVHAQGSMAIGTTVRPTKKVEMDVDLVLALRPEAHGVFTSDSLLRRLYMALNEYAATHGLQIEAKRRCVQLQYANQMHVDVTPVIHAPSRTELHGDTSGLVPDRKLSRFLETNPKGFARWFCSVASISPTFAMRAEIESLTKADVVPLPSAQIFSRLLARIVQLAKIHRNTYFASNPEIAPTSVFLTTLIGHAYSKVASGDHSSPIDLILKVWALLPSIIYRVPTSSDKEFWYLANPTAGQENLADRMNSDATRQAAFLEWHDQFRFDLCKMVERARMNPGLDELVNDVRGMFGTRASTEVSGSIRRFVERQREQSLLKIPSQATQIKPSPFPAIAIASSPHRFFGTTK